MVKGKTNKGIIPLLITIFLVLITLVVSLSFDYLLNYKHFIGFALVVLSAVLFFKSKKIYVAVFTLTLTLGFINLIDIYYTNITFGIGMIKLNPIFLGLLIMFLILNKEELNDLFPENKKLD